MVLAVAVAAPQYFYAAVPNDGRLPYSNGWTDGPNNGIGPSGIKILLIKVLINNEY